MRRLQQISSFMAEPARQTAAPAKVATTAHASPRDEMWRSRRVLSGSDWMSAWVLKPGPR